MIKAAIELLQGEFIYLRFYFLVQFWQIAPYFALGILIGSFISVFGKARINKTFELLKGGKFAFVSIICASLLGIASPLCMYGTIPIAASFSAKGVKDDILAAFIMSSILLNPQLLIYSAALGHTALVLRFASCFICGVAAGLCVHFLCGEHGFFNFTGFAAANRDTDPNFLLRFLKNVGRNLKATGGYFLAGIALSAMFQRYVPSDSFISFFGTHKHFGVFMAATIGVPLYVCGGGTIPLLMEWLHTGLSMGSVVAFMLTGPATKITNLGAFKIVLGGRAFALYLLFVTAFAFLSGIAIDCLF